MNTITAVQIIHDDLQQEEYYVLSEFLRWVGIHVYGYDEAGDWSSYQAVIVIKEQLSTQIQTAVKDMKTEQARYEMEALGEKSRLTYLKECLCCIFGKTSEEMTEQSDNVDVRTLMILAKIYVQSNYLSVKKRIDWFQENKEIIQVAKNEIIDIFCTVCNEAKNMMVDDQISNYFYYAKNFTAYLINVTCQSLKQEMLFDSGKCIEQLDLIRNFACPSKVYVLKGYLAGQDIRFDRDRIGYYQLALDCGEKASSAYYACIYFTQGRVYEKRFHNMDAAKLCYENAVKASPKEYRAQYKLAQIYERYKQHTEALEKYKTVQQVLAKKEKENYLTKTEYEYLYKSYSLSVNIAMSIGKVELAKEMIQRRNSLCQSVNPGSNLLYRQLLGDFEKQCIDATKARLRADLLTCKY